MSLLIPSIVEAAPSIYLPLNDSDETNHGSLSVTPTKTGSAGFTATDFSRTIVAWDDLTYYHVGDQDVTTQDFSFCCAVKLGDPDADALVSFGDKMNGAASNGQWAFWYDNRSSNGSPHHLRVGFGNAADAVIEYTVPSSGAALGEWGMLHFTRTGTTSLVLYLDGTQVATASAPQDLTENANNLTFGAFADGSFTLNTGDRMAHVGVWIGTALSTTQVAEHVEDFDSRNWLQSDSPMVMG